MRTRVILTEAIGGLTAAQRDRLQLTIWRAPDGQVYETGHPCTVPIYRTPARNSRGQHGAHDPYAQDLEPSGRYSAYDEVPDQPAASGFTKEVLSLQRPLVLKHITTAHGGWKTNVAHAFNRTRERLSQKLVALGYDSIITIDDTGPSEIVQLGWRTGKTPRVLPEHLVEAIKDGTTPDFSTLGQLRIWKHGKAELWYGTGTQTSPHIELASIRVPQAHRQQGHGARALTTFLQHADAAGKTVRLLASPLDKKTSLPTLMRFYQSHGFVPTGERGNAAGDPWMERPPAK